MTSQNTWQLLNTLPPDHTVILRIVERISEKPVWARPAYVDESLTIHALDGDPRYIESDIFRPSHWMHLPSVELVHSNFAEPA